MQLKHSWLLKLFSFFLFFCLLLSCGLEGVGNDAKKAKPSGIGMFHA